MTSVEAIHAAICRVYDAALTPDGWLDALASIAKAVDAHKSMLNEKMGSAAGRTVSTGFDFDSASRLRREFETRPPGWIKAIPVGTPLRQTSAISDADFMRSEIYNEAVRPAGGFYGIVAPLERAQGRDVYFCVCRDLGAADFSSNELDAMALIVPHLTTALKVQDRLAAADLRAQGALDVIAQLNVGVILLDATLRPVFVNRCAEVLAARRDGLLLTGQAVAASRHQDTQDLRRAMSAALAWHDDSRDGRELAIRHRVPTRCYLSRRAPRPPLVASVTPICSTGMLSDRNLAERAVLFVTEPDRPCRFDPIVLVRTFQLTRREAELATLLARGIDLADAASRLGIGTETARGYLKQVLAKTDTHRQAELVALLLRSGMQLTEHE
ncbi:helix-turn-helix transcriptional regulator [Burkholderia ubonensis]|uniref:helix-turn-helix transcriptional regulator n=1 Tax=Burkholderia ubonensis TaxID=101571 RepID=UPI00075AA84D|nr:helix-turn-helix transcriptional regulator [Burkholderia ubonensis]KVS42490.1 hypothetical protein WK37_18895 [Burkholderia ubonensis]KVS47041.1 hypothetical protein WK38_22700 [Burkholderia ubonensis]KVS80734.1 hypothetical protein WK43_28700 [Burkholderia ubonensis]KVS81361.1 hypothetical protein WK42_11680 [Burkholderia ubonensis]KVS95541.1 hypothetical protein WK44_07275 [Burkholderia ubonensis]